MVIIASWRQWQKRFPLSRIDDVINGLEGDQIPSCLNLAKDYRQISMAAKGNEKTALYSPYSLYQSKRMPFVQCSLPGDVPAADEPGIKAIAAMYGFGHISNIIVFSRSSRSIYTILGKNLNNLGVRRSVRSLRRKSYTLNIQFPRWETPLTRKRLRR